MQQLCQRHVGQMDVQKRCQPPVPVILRWMQTIELRH